MLHTLHFKKFMHNELLVIYDAQLELCSVI